MLQARALTRRFHAQTVVDGVDLDLPLGGRYALLGANGAGKSTTLAMLTGLLRPTSGEVRVAGLPVDRDPMALQARIGVLPERLGLFEALSVGEHLELAGASHGLDAATREARTLDLLRLMGLEEARHRVVEHCSHGMRKKTALAMALIHAPCLLVLDEPFEGLDPAAALHLQRLLWTYSSRGGTLLFTCHILPVVRELATRCLVLRKGRLVQDAPPEALDETLLEGADAPPELAWFVSQPS